MSRCTFVADKKDARVKRCAKCKLKIVTNTPPEKCHAECELLGLGDYVAMGLAAFGIKKSRGCGCGKRQSLLNRVGARLGF